MSPQDLLALLLGSNLAVVVADRVGRRLGVPKASGYMAVLALSIALAFSLAMEPGRYRLAPLTGIPPSELRVDVLSKLFVLLSTALGLVAATYSLRYMEGEAGFEIYYLLLLLAVTGMVGAALSNDLFTIYCFWELMSISAYSLVAFRWYHWEPVEAGLKYLVLSTLGALLSLYAISLVYGVAGTTNLDNLRSLLRGLGGRNWVRVVAGLFIFGFGVTTAIVPFHTWLPDAHPAAPSPISALLSGILIKTGVYVIARILFYTFPPIRWVDALLIALGLLTCTVGNLAAFRQLDAKRFLAYSSIANIGYILIGIGVGYRGLLVGEERLITLGLTGALLHMLNHALSKSLLFLCVGSAAHSIGSRSIVDMEGYARTMPITGLSSAVGLLNLAGLPPLSGFWSKLFILLGLAAMRDAPAIFALVVLAINILISGGYYLSMLLRIFGTRRGEAREVSPVMWIPEVTLAASCVLLTLMLHQVLALLHECTLALLG